MNQQQISLDDIIQEKSLADIISKRDALILTLAQQINDLQKDMENLREQNRKLKKDDTLENPE
jgi:hypothetical protein